MTITAGQPAGPGGLGQTEALYTSRIIKASALIADTKVLLSEWDLEQSVADNLDRARRQNIFGKASRKRIEDILTIFRQRYFDHADVGNALLAEPLQVIMDNGAKRVLIPLANRRQFMEVPPDVLERVDPIFYSEPLAATLKALEIR